LKLIVGNGVERLGGRLSHLDGERSVLSQTAVTVTRLHGVTPQKLQSLTASTVEASNLVSCRYTAMSWLNAFSQVVRIAHNITEWKILWKKTCGKTTTEMERQYQEGIFIAAEYKRKEKTNRGYVCLELNY
jgi:hypothetical protein